MLTGNTRFRVKGFFRKKLVLQVEQHHLVENSVLPSPDTFWRDANLQDLHDPEINDRLSRIGFTNL